ncbi:chymotrypsin-like elastase family member 2A [Styela clava]
MDKWILYPIVLLIVVLNRHYVHSQSSKNFVNTTSLPITMKTTTSAPATCPWSCEVTSSASSCGGTWKPVKKIAGGKQVERNSWPWMAAIWSGGKLQCGATLICRSWVLTAAHCFLNTNNTAIDLSIARTLFIGRYVKTGYHKTVRIFALNDSMVTIHEDYHLKRRTNDIALIKLPKPMKLTPKIRPICLPQFGVSAPKPGTKCRVAGWGDTVGMGPTNYRLKEATVPIVSPNICKFAYFFSQTQMILCAGGELGQDTCTGDSGGPLICESPTAPGQWQLQGIISFGAAKCGTEKLPGIYTQVSYYLFWIYGVMDKNCENWRKQ